jgi:crotonobetainyl-CoA:carnitine CoA-transferase CaiB-like acyl-CoA transferase
MEVTGIRGPLEGIRVLDFSQFMAGPMAARHLADYGADVIKVEAPPKGEGSRYASASNFTVAGERIAFLAANRNKRSMVLNLKTAQGIEIARRLVKTADVMIENFRPGVMDRLGLGYDTVISINDNVIYGTITGYGPEGPYRDFPGQDLLVQCLSGLAWLNGRAGDPPIAVGLPMVDSVAGQQLALGIVAALFERQKSGKGQRVGVSLLDVAIDLQAQEFTTYLNCDSEPQRSVAGIADAYFRAPYGIYETKDGYLALAHTPMAKLAMCLGLPELEKYTDLEAAFRDRDEIYRTLAGAFRTRTTQGWLDYLRPLDFWCGPVQTYSQVAKDEQLRINQMVVEIPYKGSVPLRLPGIPIKFSRTPGSVRHCPPGLGENTDQILSELGFSQEGIAELREDAVI